MAPVQTSAAVRVWFAADAVLHMEHLQYSPTLVRGYFFLFPCMMEALDGYFEVADSLKKAMGAGHRHHL